MAEFTYNNKVHTVMNLDHAEWDYHFYQEWEDNSYQEWEEKEWEEEK